MLLSTKKRGNWFGTFSRVNFCQLARKTVILKIKAAEMETAHKDGLIFRSHEVEVYGPAMDDTGTHGILPILRTSTVHPTKLMIDCGFWYTRSTARYAAPGSELSLIFCLNWNSVLDWALLRSLLGWAVCVCVCVLGRLYMFCVPLSFCRRLFDYPECLATFCLPWNGYSSWDRCMEIKIWICMSAD